MKPWVERLRKGNLPGRVPLLQGWGPSSHGEGEVTGLQSGGALGRTPEVREGGTLTQVVWEPKAGT